MRPWHSWKSFYLFPCCLSPHEWYLHKHTLCIMSAKLQTLLSFHTLSSDVYDVGYYYTPVPSPSPWSGFFLNVLKKCYRSDIHRSDTRVRYWNKTLKDPACMADMPFDVTVTVSQSMERSWWTLSEGLRGLQGLVVQRQSDLQHHHFVLSARPDCFTLCLLCLWLLFLFPIPQYVSSC